MADHNNGDDGQLRDALEALSSDNATDMDRADIADDADTTAGADGMNGANNADGPATQHTDVAPAQGSAEPAVRTLTAEELQRKRKREKRKFRALVISMIVLLLVGLGLVLYPTVADLYNRSISSRAVASYVEAVKDTSKPERDKQLKLAHEYNETLVGQGNGRFVPNEEENKQYFSILDVTGTGIMAYLTVPKLDLRVPIYHGTSDTVLQIAAGHLEGSSFPVGGPSTHAAVSGHTGLPSAMLFTGLDRLEKGDTFSVSVYDETLTYEVSDINVVLPTDVSPLEIKEGEDLMSLITCTPYGVNSHRLIVTGHRIPTPEAHDPAKVAEKAVVKDMTLIIVAIVAVIVAVSLIFWRGRRMRQGQIKHMGAKR
ncbi:class C sortase [Bifidobacterium gallicum]|nr:class C sortase [Bifidobacterium gallicum]KFI57726.1 sortase [Bifidobacterium gallicum DSM 20093 = LMG 11596]